VSGLQNYSQKTFEAIRRFNDQGMEFWLARELQGVLGYTQWRNFLLVVDKAKLACEKSDVRVKDHFADVSKMVGIGSQGQRDVDDLMLSRYACYLIVQNGDPRKEIIAVGQTYFAVQTRQQELANDFEQLSDEERRLAIRSEMTSHNKSLAEAAQQTGVVSPMDYAVFQNQGYQGSLWRIRTEGNSQTQRAKEEPKNLGPYGQY
jgi:DNA-damage-inducible protein D